MRSNTIASTRKSRLVVWVTLAGTLACTASAVLTIHHRQEQAGRKSTDPPVAATGKLGQDLFMAVGQGNLPGVQKLLKDGADPNSKNGLEFTPLFIAAAAHQTEAMKALLQAGAKPDIGSNYGTALSFACAYGNVDGCNMLLDQGAKVDTLRSDGMTPLMMAANTGVPPIVATLLAHKADVNAKDDEGATALNHSARTGVVPVGQMLLARGAQVDNPDSDNMTPLMAASENGHAGYVKLLLNSGANPNAVSKQGETPLLLAAEYGDHPDVVKLLVAAGAKKDTKDSSGWTAADYATERGYAGTVAVLGKAKPETVIPQSPRLAVSRSLGAVQKSMLEFHKVTSCVSCHQEGLGRIATGMAHDHGFKIDAKTESADAGRVDGMLGAMKPMHDQALKSPEAMKQLPLIEIAEIATTDSWILAGRAAHHEPADAASGAMASVLAKQQMPNGMWMFALPREPMQSSNFTFTALTVRSLQAYAPAADAKKTAAQIAKAKQWLLAGKPVSSEDRAFRLLGLNWTKASKVEQSKAAKAICQNQLKDGGWAQLANMQSDAYATGQALYALRETGMSVSDPVYQRGVKYLLRTQDRDGTWFVNKRAIPANNYLDSGFPHGESQYASFNGTCWAMMALLETVGKANPVAMR